jgi:hypothetical protein
MWTGILLHQEGDLGSSEKKKKKNKKKKKKKKKKEEEEIGEHQKRRQLGIQLTCNE